MSSNLSNFYGAAAQTIPVLLLTLAVETTFLAGALRSKRVEQAAASGNWADVLQSYLPVDPVGLLLRVIAYLGRPLAKGLAQPLGVAANAAFVFGSLLAAVVAEAAAFVGLAFDPMGTGSYVIVIIVFIGIGLLLIETFAALVIVVITGGQKMRGQAENSPTTGTGSTSGNAPSTG
jgi:hypothetical protein